MSEPKTFQVHWWDALLVVFIVACGLYIAFGPAPESGRSAPVLPEGEVGLVDGRLSTRIDQERLEVVCAEIGLPDPPDLNGADPVVVKGLLQTMKAWIDEPRVEPIVQLGRIYQAIEEHEAAAACFAAAHALAPNDELVGYLLGVECQSLGHLEQAAELLERSTTAASAFPLAFARLGEIYYDLGDLERAQLSYEAFAQLAPDLSLAHVGLGRIALANGDAERAVEELERAVRKTPNDYLAHRFLGRAYAAVGKERAARESTKRSDELPRYTGWLTFDERLNESHRLANTQRYLENQARRALTGQDFRLLARVFEELSRRRPYDPNVLDNLASAYRALGRYAEAKTMSDKAIELSPETPAYYCTRAEIHFAQDDYAPMHEALDRAVALDPANDRAIDLRGRALFFQGRHDEAFESMQRAIDLAPPSIGRRIILAEMYRRVGRLEDAESALIDLLRIDPDNNRARGMLIGVQGELGGAGGG